MEKGKLDTDQLYVRADILRHLEDKVVYDELSLC